MKTADFRRLLEELDDRVRVLEALLPGLSPITTEPLKWPELPGLISPPPKKFPPTPKDNP